jgi:Domain of unknown function (DUF4249)
MKVSRNIFGNTLHNLMFILCGLLLSTCQSPQQNIVVDLPAFNSEMVLECYLEPNKSVQLLLSESVSYFDSPNLQLVLDATVQITYLDRIETLRLNPTFDNKSRKGYTYTGRRLVVGDVNNDYSINITDTKGRKITATTRFLAAPKIGRIEARYNADSLAFLLIAFNDLNPDIPNYYRLLINRDTAGGNRESDLAFEDRFKTDNEISLNTSYKYKNGDTLTVSLYHIDKAHLDFIRTVQDAARANGNPFAQPAFVKSNTQGGIGIFTFSALDRRRFIIKGDQLTDLPTR